MMRIAVILPVYNGGEMLKKSIESILHQSLTDFDLIICDDCSMKDKSYEYLQNLADKRIQLFRNEQNKGLFPTLNFMVRQVRQANIIKLWSQDDIMYPNCLEETLKFHQKYPNIAFSYSGWDYIDEHDCIIEDKFIDRTPELISPWLHAKIALYTGSIAGNIANVAINKAVLNEVGEFREDMKICGDFEMWIRLSAKYDIGRISQKLIKLRRHSGQFSKNPKYFIYHLKEDMEVFRQLFDRLPKDLESYADNRMKWHRNVFYFTHFVNMLRAKDWQSAKDYYEELKKIDFIPFLFVRWLIMRVGMLLKPKPAVFDNQFLFQ